MYLMTLKNPRQCWGFAGLKQESFRSKASKASGKTATYPQQQQKQRRLPSASMLRPGAARRPMARASMHARLRLMRSRQADRKSKERLAGSGAGSPTAARASRWGGSASPVAYAAPAAPLGSLGPLARHGLRSSRYAAANSQGVLRGRHPGEAHQGSGTSARTCFASRGAGRRQGVSRGRGAGALDCVQPKLF